MLTTCLSCHACAQTGSNAGLTDQQASCKRDDGRPAKTVKLRPARVRPIRAAELAAERWRRTLSTGARQPLPQRRPALGSRHRPIQADTSLQESLTTVGRPRLRPDELHLPASVITDGDTHTAEAPLQMLGQQPIQNVAPSQTMFVIFGPDLSSLFKLHETMLPPDVIF